MRKMSCIFLMLLLCWLLGSAAAVEVSVPERVNLPATLEGFRQDQLLYEGVNDKSACGLAFYHLREYEWPDGQSLHWLTASYDEESLAFQSASLWADIDSSDEMAADPMIRSVYGATVQYDNSMTPCGYQLTVWLEKQEELPWTELAYSYDLSGQLQEATAEVYDHDSWYQVYRYDAEQDAWFTGRVHRPDTMTVETWEACDTSYPLPEVNTPTIVMSRALTLYTKPLFFPTKALEVPIRITVPKTPDADDWLPGAVFTETEKGTEARYAAGTVEIGTQAVYSPEILISYNKTTPDKVKLSFEVDPRPYVRDWEEMARQYQLNPDAKASVTASYYDYFGSSNTLPFGGIYIVFPGVNEENSTQIEYFIDSEMIRYLWVAHIDLTDPENGERFGFRKGAGPGWGYYIPYDAPQPEESSTRSEDAADYLDVSLLQPFAYSTLPVLKLIQQND